MTTNHEWIDAIVDKLREVENAKACGTLVLDIKDGRVMAGKFQVTERLKLPDN